MRMKKSVSYHTHLVEMLKDPAEAIAYLNAAIEAGDKDAFLLALRNVAEAHGSKSRLARQVNVHRVSLHKMLSSKGNPSAESLIALFRVLGIRFVMERKQAGHKHLRKAA